MFKRIILAVLFLALTTPAWCSAENIKTKDFQNQTGIKVVHSVGKLFPGYANVGTVANVDKFKKLGFKKVSAGDYVRFDTLDDGIVKITLDPTGEEKSVKIVEGR